MKISFLRWSGDILGFHILHQIQKQSFMGILKKSCSGNSQEHTREGVTVEL